VSTIVVRSVTEPEPVVDVVKPQLSLKENQMTQVIEKPDTEAIEKARRDSIVAMGEQYQKYVSDKDVLQHVMNGRSVAQFQDFIMQKMETSHTNTNELKLGMSQKEVQRYSIMRAVQAVVTGDWKQAGLERAASEAMSKLLGRSPEGFFVPFDAWQRDFTVATAAEAGNLVATDLRTDLFTDVLRNKLVLVGMGQRVLAGLTANINIPRKTVKGAISRVTEIQALTETQPTTALIAMAPKRFGGFVEYSKQSIIQSGVAIEPMLRDDLLQGAAEDLQDQCINGSGSSPNIRGIRNTAGVGSVAGGANGLAVAWSHLVDLESACANVNAEPDAMSGYVTNTKVRGASKKTQKATNLPFIWDGGAQPLNSYRAAITNSVPSNLVKGSSGAVCSSIIFGSDWSMSVLGLFGAPDVVVNPFIKDTEGLVRITLNQFADHACRLPACFAVMDDALTP
jgi:HK97 family phage major capsid protein